MSQTEDFRLTAKVSHTSGTAEPSGSHLSPSRRNNWEMFNRIASRYDLLNHVLSANRDRRWRRVMAELLGPKNGQQVLDLATGTADQLLALYDSGYVRNGIGLDMADEMLTIAREKIACRNLSDCLSIARGDAQNIPYDDNSFDAVTIAFGIRNMTDVGRALREMLRVLKPGGQLLILEFSLPSNPVIRTAHVFYLRHLLPRIGGMISGDSAAYRYLDKTVETFPYGEAFRSLLKEAGFKNTGVTPLTFGTASIYRGTK